MENIYVLYGVVTHSVREPFILEFRTSFRTEDRENPESILSGRFTTWLNTLSVTEGSYDAANGILNFRAGDILHTMSRVDNDDIVWEGGKNKPKRLTGVFNRVDKDGSMIPIRRPALHKKK